MTKPIDIVLLLMDPQADHRAVIRLAWEEDIEEFWVGLELSTSALHYDIKEIPALDPEDPEPGTMTFGRFYNLATRIGTGAIKSPLSDTLIEEAALDSNAIEWNNWYRRILQKTLIKFLPMDIVQDELLRLTTE